MVPVSLGVLDILQDVFRLIFDEVLSPILKEVFNILIYLVGDLLLEIFSGILLEGWVALLKLLNFMYDIFQVFSGLTQVKVADVSSVQNMGLLQYLFSLSVIRRSMLVVTAVSFVLAFISTGIALLKSMADSVVENKRPISTVLREAFKTALAFLLIPFACLFAVEMTTQILVQVNNAVVSKNKNASLGDTLFYTIASGYSKKSNVTKYQANRKFENISNVMDDFNYKKIDYLMAYIVTIFLMLVLLATIIQFIQRLLMLLILYVISPLFAAYMPLDGGKSFKQWRDAFVAYLISAFSPILAMDLYMQCLPLLTGDTIVYPSTINERILKLLVVLGGSFAIYTSRNMIVKIYNPSLGDQLDANGFMTGMFLGFVGKAATKGIKSAFADKQTKAL